MLETATPGLTELRRSGILKGMSEDRRTYQFGLSKLLLWTAVVGVYLGMLRALRLELIPALYVTCWLLAVIGLRATVGRKVAGLLSALAGIIWYGWIAYLVIVTHRPSGNEPVVAFLALIVGGLLGYGVLVLVEAVIYVIDWADRLMGTSNDDHSSEEDS